MNTKPVGNSLPETLQGIFHTIQHTDGLSLLKDITVTLRNLILLSTQTLSTTAAAVLSQHLVSNLILSLQLGITLLNIIPKSSSLHQFNDVRPLLRVQLTHGIRPQVRILMYRGFSSSNPLVDIYFPTSSEAVGVAICSTEETNTRNLLLAQFLIISYCSLSIFSYLCSVNVKDSVLDVCIRGGIVSSIGSLVRHLSPHAYGFHIIWAVLVFFFYHYNVSVA